MSKGLTLAKIEYQQKIQDLLEKGMKSMYGGGDTDISDAMANKFATTAAPKIASAIEMFYKSANIVGVIPCNGVISFAGVIPSSSLGAFTVVPGNLNIV